MLIGARFLAHLRGTTAKNGRRIRLGHRECNEHPDDKGEDQLDPIQPPPACSIRQVSTDEGTDRRSDERGGRERRHGDASLFVAPQVRQRAADERHGCREGDAVDSAADQKRADVLGQGLGNDEDDGDEQRAAVDDPPAIDLRQRRKHHGTNAEADDEDGDGKQSDLLAYAKGLLDADQVGGDDGRGEGDNEAGDSDHHGTVPLVQL